MSEYQSEVRETYQDTVASVAECRTSSVYSKDHEDRGTRVNDLRVALFSGNYNYTCDGASLSLNRLVGFLLEQGAAVRIYSPVVDTPALSATGDVIGVPAFPIPGRSEYRFVYRVGRRVGNDLRDFAPNLVHLSAPDILGHWALRYARRHDLPVVSSVHTRFDAYLSYYRLGIFEPAINSIMRRFYQRCDMIVAPSKSMAEVLRDQRMNEDIGVWPSGVDQDVFNPSARRLEWRRSLGIADDEVVIGFLGRLVMEKALDVFCDTIDELERRNVKARVLVVGDGPAREWFARRLPRAIFVGFQSGPDLGRAVASMDIFLNPSVTETFGIVTLEAMACGLAVIGADAAGTASLVVDGVTGRLICSRSGSDFADAIEAYIADPAQRAAVGAAAKNVAGEYSWDTVNRTLVADYLRVIDRRAHRRLKGRLR